MAESLIAELPFNIHARVLSYDKETDIYTVTHSNKTYPVRGSLVKNTYYNDEDLKF